MPMKDRLFEIWFSLRCGPANTEFRTLLEQYGTPYDLFNADESELEKLPCSDRLKAALADKSLTESHEIEAYCRKNRVGILFWQDSEYPASLRPLRDPPVLLYYRGKLPSLSRNLCISVVGTRTMTEYGKRMAYKIGYELAAAGATVVSGMALGNDSVAAAAAIAAGGTTVAVLGSGINIVYPKAHEALYHEIAEHGVVMTEYPPNTEPRGRNFPVRNRIISGLSQGTVVVEAHRSSGALITAKTAILQGRDIYAIPGNVGEINSAGTNELISSGASVVLSARDILDNYAFLYRDVINLSRLSRAEHHSEPNDAVLERLGVAYRVDDAPQVNPNPTSKGVAAPAPSPVHSEKMGTVPKRATKAAPKAASKATPKATPKAVSPDTAPSPAPVHGDASERILKSLTDTQRAIFEAIPLDRHVSSEHLAREGFSMSQIMAAITILEIKGLILTLPGGLIGRK